MKKSMIFALLLISIMAVGMTAVVAADVSMDDGTTFNLPDGYSVQSKEGNTAVLTKGTDNAICVISGAAKTSEEAKTTLEGKGYTFVEETAYTYEGKDITQQTYKQDSTTIYAYVFTDSDKDYIITLIDPNTDGNLEDTSNPATQVVMSINQ